MGAAAKRELKWFGLGFGLPFVLLLALDLATSSSRLSLWTRLTTLEDTCAYYSCVIIAAAIYGALLLVRAFVRNR